jgi:hypothetical protein
VVCANAGVRHWLGVRGACEAAWAFRVWPDALGLKFVVCQIEAPIRLGAGVANRRDRPGRRSSMLRGGGGLVNAICQQAPAGEGPVRAEVRSDAIQADEADPRQIIRGWGKLTAEIAPRVAPSCSWCAPQRPQIRKWHISRVN